MRKTDIEAVGDLAGELLAAGGTLVRDMHEGIASRPFGVLGAAAAPVRVVHDGIARQLYGSVRGALRGASRGGARIVAAHADPDAPALASGPRGSAALAALNGVYGNHLAARGSDLALGMDVRRDGADVAVTPAALAAAFPDASSRIVVFVHGLCETDDAWRLVPLRGGVARPTYGDRLRAELGFTPVYLRYNTGLRISENGRALARLLDDLTAAWPAGVEEVVLVGHSMGGLVARSACHYGESDGRRWTGVVRHLFCLGTPHLGADLEKGANVLGWALGRLPETRARDGPQRTQRRHQGSALRIMPRRGLERLRSRRVPARSLPGDAVPPSRQLLLRRRDAQPRLARLDAGRPVRAHAERVRARQRQGPQHPLRGRQRARARGPEPFRPPQPPGRLRAAPHLADAHAHPPRPPGGHGMSG
jgi:hypothetical protein